MSRLSPAIAGTTKTSAYASISKQWLIQAPMVASYKSDKPEEAGPPLLFIDKSSAGLFT